MTRTESGLDDADGERPEAESGASQVSIVNQGSGRTGIVVLNWRAASTTIRCLESILALRSRSFVLIVVDNGSGDGSADAVQEWINNKSNSLGSGESGPAAVLIRGQGNVGYAAGNNAGIKSALDLGCDSIWILNNDTRVAADSLSFLREAAESCACILGTTILMGDAPETVECLGGEEYNWLSARSNQRGRGLRLTEAQASVRLGRLDYISGASLFVPRSVIEQVGYLDETYFLYSEDVDYSLRCRSRGIEIVHCREAIVWHEHGASSGANSNLRQRSGTAVFHSARGALILYRHHRRYLVSLAVAARTVNALSYALFGRVDLTKDALRGIASGLRAGASTGWS